MKRTFSACLAAVLLLTGLAACGERPAAEEDAPLPAADATPAPAPTAVPEETPAVPSATPAPESVPSPTPPPAVEAPESGEYRYESDKYGEWILTIKDNGTFSVIGGERIFNGEGWSVQSDGSVVTGPTEAAGAAPFFDEFGCSVWRIRGESCEPVLY